MSDRDEFYNRFSKSYDKLHQSEKQDDLVERVGRELARTGYAFAGIEGLTDPYTADADYWNSQARAAIALALEAAAKVADDEACHCEDTGSAPSDFGNAGRNDAARTIAAAIRAMIPKESA